LTLASFLTALSSCATGIPVIDDLLDLAVGIFSPDSPDRGGLSSTNGKGREIVDARGTERASENISSSSRRGNPDAANWDIAALDTAKDAAYLSAVEKDVILEMNKVRSDPQKYAELYITPRLQYYSGNMYQEPGKIAIQTSEGKKAVEGCVTALAKMKGVPLLMPEEGLANASKDHVKDQGATGKTGHDGSDKSTPSTRTARYGKGSYIGENIAYGPGAGREIIVDLLIDDGVPSRGHRQNIMKKDYNQAGTAIGSHKQYGTVCVINYAKDYVTKGSAPENQGQSLASAPGKAQTEPEKRVQTRSVQKLDVKRPESLDAAYTYRTGAADSAMRRIPSGIESLRTKDQDEYLRQAAGYIAKNSKNQFDKTKKAHDLVALNIRYDAASFLANRQTPQDYAAVIRTRLAVCEGYSNLFKALCDELDIPCEIVHGYARGVGSSSLVREDPSDSNHAWNIVNIEGGSYLVDCTWDAGHLNGRNYAADYSTDYFLLKPEYFIYSHFPEDPGRQLLEKPLSSSEFSRLPFCRPKYFEVVAGAEMILPKLSGTEKGEVTFDFGINEGFIPDFVLYSEDEKTKFANNIFVQKEGGVYRAYLSFPSAGSYLLRFFYRKQGGRSGEFCAEYGVIADTGSNILYPTQYASFGDSVTVMSPIKMPLKKNTNYEFRIRADDKKIIALMYNKNFIPFEKDEEGVWFLAAEIPSNVKELTIGSANSARGSYTGIVTYTVE
jgi:uncharacterized protein YkwD